MTASPPFLPYGRHHVDELDAAALLSALRSGHLTTGPTVGAFEARFAELVGASHAVACANGTAALHLAMLALDVEPGEVCIVPAVTFLATANAVRFVGGEVVFADVDPETGLTRAADVEAALARATGPVKAIVPVHLAGHAAPIDELGPLAARRGAALVEDACHALGTTHGLGGAGGRIGDGRFAVMQAFSFHPVKTIACGEGGMLTTGDPRVARRLALLRNHGMVRDPTLWETPELGVDPDGGPNGWVYEMAELGYNYRLSDLQAALGLSQLDKLPWFAARRRRLAALYGQQLAPLAPLVRPLATRPRCEPVLHLYVTLIDFAAAGKSRGRVMRELAAKGIGTQVHYIPVNRQPYYRRRYGDRPLPGAEAYYARCLSLPLFPAMDDGDVSRVVGALGEVLLGRSA